MYIEKKKQRKGRKERKERKNFVQKYIEGVQYVFSKSHILGFM